MGEERRISRGALRSRVQQFLIQGGLILLGVAIVVVVVVALVKSDSLLPVVIAIVVFGVAVVLLALKLNKLLSLRFGPGIHWFDLFNDTTGKRIKREDVKVAGTTDLVKTFTPPLEPQDQHTEYGKLSIAPAPQIETEVECEGMPPLQANFGPIDAPHGIEYGLLTLFDDVAPKLRLYAEYVDGTGTWHGHDIPQIP